VSQLQTHNNPAGDLKYWQYRIFASVWITYFAYYLCRLNMPVAKTRLCETFSWDAGAFGLILSAMTFMYAVGQFVNGQLADRFGARMIASLGVFGSVAMNLAVFAVVLVADPDTVSPKTVLFLIAFFWGINGFFQAMGWSPMVRIMAHWFPLHSRGKVMGAVGTCYQLGAAVASLLAYFLVVCYVERLNGDWRTAFLVPAVLFSGVGIFFFMMIRNQPEDVGLPPVDRPKESQIEDGYVPKRTLISNVFATLKNPYLWIVAGTFFLLDVNRYGFVNWLPAYIDKHRDPSAAGVLAYFKDAMKLCILPLAGSAGVIVAGWATDRFFGGRRAPVIAILLMLLGVFSIVFPYVNPNNVWLILTVVAIIGFCTYGPHILMVGHAAQDFGKKHGAAGAAGFIDAMGYLGATLAGWGAGQLIETKGYTITFETFGSAAILGALFISVIWKVRPHAS